jgi:hypothetical protein
MSLTTLIACVGCLGALQAAYLFVKSMDAKPVDGPSSSWGVADSNFFEESEETKNARKMKKNFEIARAKAIMAMASEFAETKAKS